MKSSPSTNQGLASQNGLLNESGGTLVLKAFAVLSMVGGMIGWGVNFANGKANGGAAPLMALAGVGSVLLLRRAEPRLASYVLVWGLLCAITYGAFFGSGLQSASWVVMPVAVMFIGWMLGYPAAIVLACATILDLCWMLWLHFHGHVFIGPSLPAIFATALILLTVIAATIGGVTASTYQSQLIQVRTLHDQLLEDIARRKEYERTLEHIAHFDALTNLPNRVLLSDRLQQAMAQALRRDRKLAVVFLDLDGFKAANDTHGHAVGDQLLIALADRMRLALREGDTLARLGGDEFVAVLIDMDDFASHSQMVSRLLESASQPVRLGELLLQSSASAGVTFYPQAQDLDADQLLRQADQAMYEAKLAGKNRFCIFDTDQDSSARVNNERLDRIRLALKSKEFVLHYQPKVNMRTGKVVGAEALIRWQHPQEGLLSPVNFLPLIENDPLAVEVGEWVIDQALNQIESWREAGLDLPVSVNIGARQLQQANFVDQLKIILERHPQVSAANLELEVLETNALADIAQVSTVIDTCHRLGIKFALDDFGTGYSSLTYLKRLRVAMLKIDQSFVLDMLDDQDDLAILEGVVGLADAFKREVIAEGVESVAHGAALLLLGCELAQGFGIARPMPAELMPGWVATWRPDEAWLAIPAPGQL